MTTPTTQDRDVAIQTPPSTAWLWREFKEQKRWMVWRTEQSNGGRPTKVPYRISGIRASSTNPEACCSYDEALAVVSRYDGLGFAMGDPFALVDLDGCRNPETGEIEPW